MDNHNSRDSSVHRCPEPAAAVLRAGGVIIFPTDTVYGYGADATNPEAMRRLLELKSRPEGKPAPVLLAEVGQAAELAQISPYAARLMRRYWPGALTLVLPGLPDGCLAAEALGPDGSVGLRVPGLALARELIRLAGCPVAAPSANPAGGRPPGTLQEALDQLRGDVDAALEGGPCPLGLPSTVVRVLDADVEILREGAISASEIRAAVGSEA